MQNFTRDRVISLNPKWANMSQKYQKIDKKFQQYTDIEIKIQLDAAYSHIRILQQTNKQLLAKIEKYEDKIKSMQKLEAQVLFLRDSQRQMKHQIISYKQINQRMATQLSKIEKNKINNSQMLNFFDNSELKEIKYFQNKILDTNKAYSQQNIQLLNTISDNQSHLNSNNCAQNSNNCAQNINRSKNHPLTPKSKMKINFQQISHQQMNSFQKINARRRVFLQ